MRYEKIFPILRSGPCDPHDESMRFTELQPRIPAISQRTLTLTLRQAERDVLVVRTAYPGVPPRVEYEPTRVGLTLESAFQLAEWVGDHGADVGRSRRRYDTQKASDR